MTTNDMSDTGISAERLAFLKLWAEQSDDEITLKASEVRELLASRTQSPAEWQVDVLVRIMEAATEAKNRPIYGDYKGDWSPLSHRELAKALRAALSGSKE